MPPGYHIYPLGDQALTIELGNSIDPAINQQCLDIALLLSKQNIPGVKDIIPAYATVSVLYDAAAVFHLPNIVSAYTYISQQVHAVMENYRPARQTINRQVVIPACFDISLAPDLAMLSAQKNLTPQEVTTIFCSRAYRVYLVGFLPGFAYMGKVDDAIAMNRKETPHLAVAPGSIGIAGNQTGIYPLTSPGGWNIIGRTPLRLFDKDSGDPCLLQAGDEVTFSEISIETFHRQNHSP